MDADAEVGTDYAHRDVETQTYAGARSEFLEELGTFEFAAGTLRVVFEQPHVARIKECGAVKRTEYRETVLYVKFKLKRTRLVEVTVDHVARRAVAARTDGAHRESSHGVGAAAIELLGVRHFGGVAVGMSRSDGRTRPQRLASAELSAVHYLRRTLDELREWGLEESLLPFLPAELVD